MKYLLLLIPLLFAGCHNLPKEPAYTGPQPQIKDAEQVGIITAIELGDNEKGRKALEEISKSLDVFCGQGGIDKLTLIRLFRDRLGKRAIYLFMLLDRAGAEINPSDTVAWGGLACSLRNGIKYGLDLQ